MADNVTLSAGSADGAVIATDDIGSVHYQIIRLAFGALGTSTLVHSSEGLPVNIVAGVSALATAAKQDTQTTALQLLDDTVYVDDADWTDDTSKHLLVGGVYQSTPHTVTDGDVTPFLTDANGRLAVAVNGTVAVSNAGLTELAAAINASSQMDVNIAANDIGLATSAKQDTIIGHVDGIEGLLTTIDTDTGNIATSAALLDDVVYVDDADWTDDTSKHALVGGVYQGTPHTVTDGDVTPFLTDANGRLAVVVSGTVAVSNAGLTELAAAINASSQMDVNIAASGATVPISHAALTELAAAIDTEMQVDIVGALPAGTNAIGKLAANDGVDIGDVTLTAGTNAIGKVLPTDQDVTAHTNYAKKYYTSAGAATDGIIWSPAAGKRWHVTSFFVQVSAAATVTIEDDKAGGDETIWKAELAANSGVFMTFDPLYPWASGEDAADLLITTSAGNVYVTAVGYEV